MRDLDSINPAFMKPSKFSRVGALLLFLLACICIPLAYGPVPDVPLLQNPIVLLLIFMVAGSIVLFVIPSMSKWGWKTQYFGFTSLCIGSCSFLTIVPCLVLFLYGKGSYSLNLFVLMFYIITHVLWCRRFFVIYGHLYANEELRGIVYQEESDAVYYLQRGDKYLLENLYKFAQIPRGPYFVIFMLIAFFMIPVMDEIKHLLEIPFAHIFLIIGMLPLSWMCIGLAVRGYLIFYWYPAKVKKSTGKDVYVDLVGNCPTLNKKIMKDLRKELK